MHLVRCISVGLCVITLAACTQDPAQVEYKGGQFYGREHPAPLDGSNQETYSPDSPRYKEGYVHPVEPVKAPVVASSDLPPPTASSDSKIAAPTAVTVTDNAPQTPAVASAPATQVTSADTTVTATPAQHFIFPMAGGKIISHFGPKSDGTVNDGVNIAADEGEPIWVAADGTVVYAGNELQGYGNMVIVRHEGGWMTAYAHARSLSVKKGDVIKQGTLIGYVGSTGGVKTPQLHFVLRKGKTPVDPEQYLASGNTAQAQ